jgi:catechol 2,3-dioxygenase-like lactoylglutathione lyase family enzyme
MSARLEGFAIHVRDVEKALDFYRRIPGARQLTHRRGHIAIVAIGRSTVNLVRISEQPPFHLEIETDELDALYDHLRAEGFEISGPPVDKPWGERTFYARDPEGNHLEFSQSTRREE